MPPGLARPGPAWPCPAFDRPDHHHDDDDDGGGTGVCGQRLYDYETPTDGRRKRVVLDHTHTHTHTRRICALKHVTR